MSDHLLFRRKKNRQQFLYFSPPEEGKQHLIAGPIFLVVKSIEEKCTQIPTKILIHIKHFKPTF